MRLWLLALALVALPARSQPAGPPAYWIVVDATVDAPNVTPRALERRALRGTPGTATDRALAPEARTALERLGVEIRVESRWFGAVSAVLSDAQREAVAALPFVREVRPLGRMVSTDAAPTLPLADAARTASPVLIDYGPSATQLGLVHADALIEAGYTGVGVRVGFLDTLFDFTHPALAEILSSGRLRGLRDFIGGTQTSYHGLATTSVTFGNDEGHLIGPAFSADVLAGTTEYAPTETHAEEDAFVAGLEWMEANGADVVNVSLGYTEFDPGEGDYTYADLDGNTAIVTRAVDRAASHGLIVVVSAGNEGASPWRTIGAPADADSAIVVAAVTASGTRASFSSVGPTADGRLKPDVAAQGVSVVVANTSGGYSTSNGTSFSAPMVTGIVAQLLQARPSLTPIQVRDLLRSTASQAAAPDSLLGWGIANAKAAFDALGTFLAAPPETDWRLYPSVARPGAVLTIETQRAMELDVLDLTGRIVARLGAVRGRRAVEVPDLPTGLYLVRPSDGSGDALRLAVVR